MEKKNENGEEKEKEGENRQKKEENERKEKKTKKKTRLWFCLQKQLAKTKQPSIPQGHANQPRKDAGGRRIRTPTIISFHDRLKKRRKKSQFILENGQTQRAFFDNLFFFLLLLPIWQQVSPLDRCFLLSGFCL